MGEIPSCCGDQATPSNSRSIFISTGEQDFPQSPAKHLGQMKGIRKSASLLLKVNTNMSSIISEISGICAKDLLSSEARYHSSNDAFVRIVEM